MTTCELAVPAELPVEPDESTRTVITALAVNLTVAGAKATVGVLTGSASILAEAGHSVVNTTTQALLLAGLKRSHPDRPNAEYAWGVTAAVSMFSVGACYAFWEGIHTLMGPDGAGDLAALAVVVLVGSAAGEAMSWWRAMSQLRRGRGELSLLAHLRSTSDTAAKAVLLEDSADLAGCALATVGITLRAVTGSAVWDGVASLLIGVLITAVAWHMGSHNLRMMRG